MLGTIVNTMAIIAGRLVGLIFNRFIPTKITDSLIHAVAFAVILSYNLLNFMNFHLPGNH